MVHTWNLFFGVRQQKKVPLSAHSKHTHSAFTALKGIGASSAHFWSQDLSLFFQWDQNKLFRLLTYFECLNSINYCRVSDGASVPPGCEGLKLFESSLDSVGAPPYRSEKIVQVLV